MIQHTVERMYTESEENRFLEVTYANGDKETLYFKDFNSGAMIQNIVDRGKKMAIKDLLDHRPARAAHAAPAGRVRRRVPRERGPAEHHQPGRLGAHLRQEGRADRLHPHARLRRQGQPRPAARSTPSATPASTCSCTPCSCWACPSRRGNVSLTEALSHAGCHAGFALGVRRVRGRVQVREEA